MRTVVWIAPRKLLLTVVARSWTTSLARAGRLVLFEVVTVGIDVSVAGAVIAAILSRDEDHSCDAHVSDATVYGSLCLSLRTRGATAMWRHVAPLDTCHRLWLRCSAMQVVDAIEGPRLEV